MLWWKINLWFLLVYSKPCARQMLCDSMLKLEVGKSVQQISNSKICHPECYLLPPIGRFFNISFPKSYHTLDSVHHSMYRGWGLRLTFPNPKSVPFNVYRKYTNSLKSKTQYPIFWYRVILFETSFQHSLLPITSNTKQYSFEILLKFGQVIEYTHSSSFC